MNYKVCISEEIHKELYEHLFPGDGKEAVAIALCGRAASNQVTKILLHKIMLIPYDKCIREESLIKWKTDSIIPFLEAAMNKNMAIIKIHSHPSGYDRFSETDDESDLDLFNSVFGWTDTDLPHASLVMLPNGELFGRVITKDLKFTPISRILIIGDEIRMFSDTYKYEPNQQDIRTRQLFGKGTISLLSNLSVAVVGCSGTGSPVIEQLARLGIGRLILVDPDKVEYKNLNRILNTRRADAEKGRYKVDVLKEAIDGYGFNTDVRVYANNLFNDREALNEIASCDVLFGCVDSVDGRHLLNHLSSFYLLAYFDLGVKLIADGMGGIDQVAATVHYIQAGKSSLRTRGVYNEEDLRAAGMYRVSPEEYRKLKEEGYIKNVNEDRPAVVSVNMLIASIAVNEFLARAHNYRNDESSKFAITRVSLKDSYIQYEEEGEVDLYLKKFVGRGNTVPFLNLPELN